MSSLMQRSSSPLPWKKKIYFSLGLGSGGKYFLHRQSVLSATLFMAQPETAELTAVMSLVLMECFVPRCVRMPPGSVRAARGSSMQQPRWLTVAPFFKCKETITISLSQALHDPKYTAWTYGRLHFSVMALCVNVTEGIGICGCRLELRAHAKVG